MRSIAAKHLIAFAAANPNAAAALRAWRQMVRLAGWQSMNEVQATANTAKVLNGSRVRFEIAGGNFRLIASIDFKRQIVFVKFLGTHAQYDRVDALSVSQF